MNTCITLFIVQNSIGDEVLADAKLSSDMGKRGHLSDDSSLENGDDIEGNGICKDWTETFFEYYVCDQLEGSVCHLSEMGEEFFGIFSVSMLLLRW